jgi:hypothetical protein
VRKSGEDVNKRMEEEGTKTFLKNSKTVSKVIIIDKN